MSEEMKEPQAPLTEGVSPDPVDPAVHTSHSESGSPPIGEVAPEDTPPPGEVAPAETAADELSSSSDPYHSEPYESPASLGSAHPGQAIASYQPPAAPLAKVAAAPPAKHPPPPPPPPDEENSDPEEEGMLRMSFMQHLEELRHRILRALTGMAVAFVVSLTFVDPLWRVVSEPAVTALKHLGYVPNLVAITPMEQFSVIYVKMPLLVSVFLASPWVLYQVWAFISPGLYKRERRYAVPFILSTAGLFIAGGCFAYFIAFRYGIEFLLGIGKSINVAPMVSIDEYFALFVNVTVGVGLVFEMPVLIFFLTLLRVASPRFLIRNSRYAILAIVIIAAVVTPTPDVFNLMLFAVPMCLLFFVGVFASYLLVLKREGKKFPWGIVLLVALGIIVLIAALLGVLVWHYHFHFIPKWPYLIK